MSDLTLAGIPRAEDKGSSEDRPDQEGLEVLPDSWQILLEFTLVFKQVRLH